MRMFERLVEGKPVWAPFYTYHKIMAGLLDMYVLTGNTDALKVAEGMADWVGDFLWPIGAEQRMRMLRTEYGGMNEALVNLAALTKNDKYIGIAHLFEQPSFLDPLAARRDELEGLHANTHVPKIIGAARMYEVTGDRRYREIAEYFLEEVIGRAQLRDRQHERGRILAHAARPVAGNAGLEECRVLRGLQPDEAGAPRLWMDRRCALDGRLRARALQLPAGHAERRRPEAIFLPARGRILARLQFAGRVVLVLHGHGRGGVCEVRRHHLLPPRQRRVRESVPCLHAGLEGRRPDHRAGDAVPE